ncbi:TIGR02234 family membrane protein [Tsukamurella soli]|uniref:TIGR02234 family membrane protein n=1 Tax=Tsukamurella soli TaxID=644556 RepID=A0ABP8K3K7_9ACTN
MTARRSLGITSALLVVAAVLLWVSSRMTWVAVTVADGLSPERHLSASGQQWAGALTPLALVILAGIAAAVALKNRMRRVVAVLIAVVAVAATVPALGVLTSDPDVGHAEQALDLPHKDVVVLIDAHHVAPVVALLGSLAAVAAAVVLIRGSRSTGGGAGMDGRYLAPGARRAELERKVFADAAGRNAGATGAEPGAASTPQGDAGAGDDDGDGSGLSERDLWDALDTGADPTEVDGEASAGPGDVTGGTGR